MRTICDVAALSLRAALELPEVRVDLHWLLREREALGDDAFRLILAQLLDAETVEVLMDATRPEPDDQE